MRNAEIDALILASSGGRWTKMAMVVAKVGLNSGLSDKAWGYDAIAKRIRKLVKRRKIEAVGDIWNWRRSEIRHRQISGT